MYTYNVEIRRVVDGDTIDVFLDLGAALELPGVSNVDLGFSVVIKNGRLVLKERVRLFGVDTPESRTRDLREKKFGKMATARVEELLPVGAQFTAISKSYDKTGKFGRAMLDFDLPDGRTLAAALVEEYMAVPYHGQNKKDIRAEHEANWAILDATASS